MVVDNQDQPCPTGQVGQLLVQAGSVFSAYHGLPEKTVETFLGPWMRTGDLARVDDDGYYYLVGRQHDMILTGGFNVYPREVEKVLCEHQAIDEAAVFGVPDADLGEKVVAVLVSRHEATPDIIEWARQRLTPYKCPRAVKWVPALPRNSMGKIQKNILRARWAPE